MKKIKQYFESSKKKFISVLCVMVILGVGTVCAVSVMAKGSPKKVSIDEAKTKALNDAGLDITEVTFTKEKLDYDNGICVYELEFFTENAEYEYELYADTGAVYSKSKETFVTRQTDLEIQNLANAEQQQNAEQPQQSAEEPRQNAEQPQQNAEQPQQSAEEPQQNAEQPQQSAEEPQQNAEQQPQQSAEQQPQAAAGSGNSGNISVDQAKSIATSHAGYSVSEVQFSKAKLEKDDGMMIYEIEFYKDGMEYEYEINALTGEILDFDSEWDD